jgi:hypothetical protein
LNTLVFNEHLEGSADFDRLERERQQRGAAIIAASRRPEAPAPTSAPNISELREALRRAQEELAHGQHNLEVAEGALARLDELRAKLEAKLAEFEGAEAAHRDATGSALRDWLGAGAATEAPTIPLASDLAESRAGRASVEGELAAVNKVGAELAEGLAQRRREFDVARVRVHRAAKAVMAAEARTIADQILAAQRIAADLYALLEPLAPLWFPDGSSGPGSTIPIDTVTAAVLNDFTLAKDDQAPSVRRQQVGDSTAAWHAFFARLVGGDADAGLEAAPDAAD